MNYCSTSNTSWPTPESRTVYRDGKRIGAIVNDGNGKWECLWIIDTPTNRQAMELRLALMNRA